MSNKPTKIAFVSGKFRPLCNDFGYNFYEQRKNIEAARDVGLAVFGVPGWAAFIPHMNTADFQGALANSVWLDADLLILSKCDAVVTVPGWEQSQGARAEVLEAQRLGIPVVHCPKDLVHARPRKNPVRETLLQEVGNELAEARQAQGMSLRQLHKETGVSPATLLRMERGKNANLTSYLKVREFLNDKRSA